MATLKKIVCFSRYGMSMWIETYGLLYINKNSQTMEQAVPPRIASSPVEWDARLGTVPSSSNKFYQRLFQCITGVPKSVPKSAYHKSVPHRRFISQECSPPLILIFTRVFPTHLFISQECSPPLILIFTRVFPTADLHPQRNWQNQKWNHNITF